MLSFPDLDDSIGPGARARARVAVDATMLTPVLLRPLEHGADSRCTAPPSCSAAPRPGAGIASCATTKTSSVLHQVRRLVGLIGSPDPAWLLLRSLKTLPLRVRRCSADRARAGATAAGASGGRERELPGLGDEVRGEVLSAFGRSSPSFVRGARAAAQALESSCELIENATSFGGARSTIESRSRWEGERVPLRPAQIERRLEDVDDLWRRP